MNNGWISLHRSVLEHWIFKDKREFSKFEAWIDILLNVNHSTQKIIIKNSLFIVNRGESIRSLESWSKRWNWNKSKVRRFLNLLQDDNMIVIKSEQKTTRLTVCNYDSYQDKRNDNETILKHKRNDNETILTPNNNDNNVNNENNEKINIKDKPFSFYNSLISLGADKQIVNDWLKVRKAKKGVNTKTSFDCLKIEFEKSKKPINEILKICVTNNWVGFKANWLNKEIEQTKPQKIAF